LEKLFTKDFNRKDITITAPGTFPQADIDIVDNQFLLQDGQLPEDEYAYTDAKDLYSNFKKLLKSKEIG